jgi:hypothetical protein
MSPLVGHHIIIIIVVVVIAHGNQVMYAYRQLMASAWASRRCHASFPVAASDTRMHLLTPATSHSGVRRHVTSSHGNHRRLFKKRHLPASHPPTHKDTYTSYSRTMRRGRNISKPGIGEATHLSDETENTAAPSVLKAMDRQESPCGLHTNTAHEGRSVKGSHMTITPELLSSNSENGPITTLTQAVRSPLKLRSLILRKMSPYLSSARRVLFSPMPSYLYLPDPASSVPLPLGLGGFEARRRLTATTTCSKPRAAHIDLVYAVSYTYDHAKVHGSPHSHLHRGAPIHQAHGKEVLGRVEVQPKHLRVQADQLSRENAGQE